MKLPTLKKCQDLFTKYKVPKNIYAHCQKVSETSTFLAQQLIKNNYPLDLKIVQRLSLLHDLLKVVYLPELTYYSPANYTPTAEEIAMHQQLRQQFPNTNEVHAAYLIFKDDYPEFARFFLELEEITKHPQAPASKETHLVHYVDYRVMNNDIVMLDERMAKSYLRYQHFIQQNNLDWSQLKKLIYEYEHNLFKHLDFKPEELKQKIEFNK